ncbi:leucine--tRNA ligase [Candidatus Kaiserbacteria bacterium RIFCSPHIGHO2_01_FULL_49_13]|uniref:Leucine--tRNA ligase n=1 Tax=Candidatus Kaiserbacteria bacterium RIFCSPHIGHO2_01_FULL_49_13 TaxID=1798477 RepID=A0A1F6CF18_9BACT|nr:MAG: leucine--tRNA ligase [Candidatus Kaiserbacteria bacterium RIFCSPHIGHO2_01_FULL_49_13]
MEKYDHKRIEKKWQAEWEKTEPNRAENDSKKKKNYILIEFPYPSGDGLHTGHVRSYTALDVVARKRRGEGFNVLYPIGWDAFGLPTENYAIKTGTSPEEATRQNTNTFRRQLKALGISFDWSREINTTDPKYYKWTQWIFLQMYKHGLAYKAKMPINWCPTDKIGLANEEVVDGKCERCGTPVLKREREQWMLAITKYADRLHADLDTVDYEERIKIQQRNWIGRSEGTEITFKLVAPNFQDDIPVFTTRSDTLYGATYLVLAPEHPLIEKLAKHLVNWQDVLAYIVAAKQKSDIERIGDTREKTGIKLIGIEAINPATKRGIPVFIADYVLAHYGTGAIMAVPAHDERDYDFAKKYTLPITPVIEPVFMQTTEPGKIIEGLPFDERDAVIVIVKHWAEEKYLALRWKQVAWGTFITGGIEKGQTPEEAARMEVREETGFLNLELRANYGVIHGKFYHVPKKVNRFAHSRTLLFQLTDNVQTPVSPEEQEKHEVLWLAKNELKQFLTPDSHQRALELLNGKEVYVGEGLLANSGPFTGISSENAKKKITEAVEGRWVTTYRLRDWVFSRQRYWGEPIPIIHCEKCGMVPVPETDLPVILPAIIKYQPTDTGESPLASMADWVNVACPSCEGAAKRETDVMPNWAGSSWYFLRYTDPHNDAELADKKLLAYWIPVDWYNGGMEHTTLHLLYSRFWHKFLFDLAVAATPEPYAKRTSHGLILASDGKKMSKSLGNVVNPDEIVEQFGADTLRVYEMFMGPFDQPVSWSTANMVGSRRFLERVWRMVSRVADRAASAALESSLHESIKKVSADIEAMKFNTAISQLMILANEFDKEHLVPREVFALFTRILAPFAPHLTEEIWLRLNERGGVHDAAWPKAEEGKIVRKSKYIAIQVNGKLRATLEATADASEREIKETALALPAIQKWLEGKNIAQIIEIPGRLLNVVTN